MKYLNKIYPTLLIILIGTGLQVQAQSLSNTPGSFVDIGYGIRASGLGFAYTGLAEGSDAIMWNPAGLSQSQDLDVSLMYTKQYNLVNYNYISASMPFRGQTLALAVISSGDDVLREHSVHAGYSRKFGNLHVGGVVKFRLNTFGDNTLNEGDYVVFDPGEINQGFARQIQGSGKGLGIDLGLMYKVSEQIQLGVQARDVYAPFSWDSETKGDTGEEARGSYSEDIPAELIFGLAYNYEGHLFITTDFIPEINENVDAGIIRAGIEKRFLNVLYLRGGTEQNLQAEAVDHYMAGFGLKTPEIQDMVTIMVNYTYVMNDFENSHRIGLQLKF